MKGLRRLSSILLAVMLCVGIINIPVFAASTSQDGLEVTLTTDKKEYSRSEEITATLTVKNTNSFAVKNVSLEGIVPEGYEISNNTEAIVKSESFAAGETLQVTVKYVAEANSGVGEEGTTDSSDSESADSKKDSSDASSIDTGDGNNIILWSVLLVGAFGSIVAIVIVKKRGRNLLSVLLCVTMIGTSVAWPAKEVKAAENNVKTFKVEEVVQVAGENITLQAAVSYQFDENDEESRTYSRGEWIKKLVDTYGHPYNVEGERFIYTDVEESPYRAAIETAVVYNILMPEDGEAFHPDEVATREFAAETAVNCMGYTLGDAIDCVDKEDIANKSAMKIAVELELLSLENNYLYPKRPLNQKEADKILKLVEAEFDSHNSKEESDEIVFLDSVVQKEGTFDWVKDGNTAIVPAGEDIPEVGQIITFGYEEAIKVESVKEVNGQTQITYSKPELYEFLDSMDLQGEAIMDFSQFVPAEGVTVNSNTSNAIQSRGFADDAFDIPSNELSTNVETELSGAIDLGEGWEIGYSLGLNVPTVGYKFDIDFDANPFNDEPFANVKNAYIKVHNDINAHVDFGRGVDTGDDSFDDSEFDDILEKEIDLGSVPLVGVKGLCVEVDLDLVITAEGKFEIDYNVHGTTGVQVRNNRPKNISALQSSMSVGLQAGISVGPRVGLEAEVFGEDVLSFAAEAGGKASGSVHLRSTGLVCMDASAYVYAKLLAFEDCLIDEWLDISVTYPIWDENNSPINLSGHWENLNKVRECTYDNKGTIKGTVANADNRTQYISGAVIEVMDNDDFTNEATVYSDARGEYIAAVPGGTHLVRISADGYLPFESLETVGEKQEIYLETYLLVEGSANSNEKGTISGKITNAVTGATISNVKLTIRKGWNMTSGTVVETLETDSAGKYSVKLPIGNYTIAMEHDGYISNHINVAVTKNGNSGCHGVLSPDGNSSVELGDMRIILTWTDEPSDLDSHLWGPTVNGDDMYHIYYRNMSYYHGGTRCAFLDLDDTYYDGPETTTIYDMKPNGTYSFYVHDFTNRGNANSRIMANSGAKVQVYMGETLIGQFHVPTSGVGDVWHVFDFDATTGTMKPVNTFSCVGTSSNVGNSRAIMSRDLEDRKIEIDPPKEQQ